MGIRCMFGRRVGRVSLVLIHWLSVDVAFGLLWVVDHCTRPQKDVAGFQCAGGNGNMIVGGTSDRW
jgi:hypothetical protein